MGLSRSGYSDALQGRTRVAVYIDENGDIATSDTTTAGTFNYSISQANPENSLADNQKLLNFFINEIAGGSTSSDTNVATVTWTV